MTTEQMDYLAKEHKFAGFGTRFNDQVKTQAEMGITEFHLHTQDYYEKDRMLFKVASRLGDSKAFYNGFEAFFISNMPPDFKEEGVDLRGLEIMLSAPPQQFHGKNEPAGNFEKQVQLYKDAVIADLTKLYNINKDLFYKVAFIYSDVVDPLLAADRKDQVHETIKAMMGPVIRKQWFPRDQDITRIEAYNLMAEVEHKRAVYKIYRNHQENSGEGEGQQTAATDNKAVVPGQEAEKAERKVYGVWFLMDYKDVPENSPDGKLQNPTKYGNRLFERFDDNYGFQIREVLQRFSWKGINADDTINELAKALEKGNKVEVAPTDQSEHKTVFIYANPAAKTITIEDHDGNRLAHNNFLTATARQDREEKQQFGGQAFRVAGRPVKFDSTGQAQGDGEDEKKNNNQHPRLIQGGEQGPGQKI